MFYTANAEIKIGSVTIIGVTDVEFEQSVDTIGGTVCFSENPIGRPIAHKKAVMDAFFP